MNIPCLVSEMGLKVKFENGNKIGSIPIKLEVGNKWVKNGERC